MGGAGGNGGASLIRPVSTSRSRSHRFLVRAHIVTTVFFFPFHRFNISLSVRNMGRLLSLVIKIGSKASYAQLAIIFFCNLVHIGVNTEYRRIIDHRSSAAA